MKFGEVIDASGLKKINNTPRISRNNK